MYSYPPRGSRGQVRTRYGPVRIKSPYRLFQERGTFDVRRGGRRWRGRLRTFQLPTRWDAGHLCASERWPLPPSQCPEREIFPTPGIHRQGVFQYLHRALLHVNRCRSDQRTEVGGEACELWSLSPMLTRVAPPPMDVPDWPGSPSSANFLPRTRPSFRKWPN